jgi:hypothetical protein
MLVAEILLLAALAWLLAGLAVAVPFVVRGVRRIDEAARHASVGFHLVILPGAVALWPMLLRRWLKAPSTGEHP